MAEGIETDDDLRVLRDFGIHYGQRYFLGRPNCEPTNYLGSDALQVLLERQVMVFLELSRSAQGGHLCSVTVLSAPHVTERSSNDELAAISWPNLLCMPWHCWSRQSGR